MIQKIKYIEELEKLNLPKEDFVICGSATMVLKGIINTNNDIDVTVNENLWKLLKSKYNIDTKYVKNILKEYIQIGNIEIMHTTEGCYGHYKTVDEMINNAEIVDGYRICPLEDVIKYIAYFNNEKGKKRLVKINEYLAKKEK